MVVSLSRTVRYQLSHIPRDVLLINEIVAALIYSTSVSVGYRKIFECIYLVTCAYD